MADGSSDTPARPPRAGGLAPHLLARAHLECLSGPEKGKEFRIAPGVTVIGRDASCDVVLTESAISRRHCRIERRGDDWILVNESANGTRINKDEIDEAVLANETVFRIGAKTRLRFVIEQVAVSATGRPQFRARTGPRGEDEDLEDEAEEEVAESLFVRKRKLFIALGAYLGIVLAAAVAGLIYTAGKTETRRGVPIMGIEPKVVAPDGVLLDIVRTTRDDTGARLTLEWPSGRTATLSGAELKAQGYDYVPGMRPAVEEPPKPYDRPVNLVRAELLRDQAIELYDRRDHEPANLFFAVRRFQESLAYYGDRSFFPDPRVDRIYRDAVDNLLRQIQTAYGNAVLHERAGNYERARALYKKIVRILGNEPDNPIFKNVSARLAVMGRGN